MASQNAKIVTQLDGANSSVSVIDAGFPGTLPSLNRECVVMATKAGMALSSQVNPTSTFDRKHYFYPDLPCGFQITQHATPIAIGGYLDLMKDLDGLSYDKRDSGRTISGLSSEVLVDLNRAGFGVLEIVTEPDFNTGDEVVAFMTKMKRLLWYLEVADPNMDEGALRCDINISVRSTQSSALGEKIEIKHVSKLSPLPGAIDFEISRQIGILEGGGQELLYEIETSLPENMDRRRNRLRDDYDLNGYTIGVLMDEPGAVDFFEKIAAGRDTTKAVNWLTTNVFACLKQRNMKLKDGHVSPERIASVIDMVEGGRISGLRGKDILSIMFDGDSRDPLTIATDNDWLQVTDHDEISKLLDELLAAHPEVVELVKKGKERKAKFFVGEVMKITKGKSNPQVIDGMLKAKLKNL
ncbi:hypothetical protein HDU76_012462 [Blyttiomyces sp. JEL0837]|nr:hypothetical protein HDU76_012462 [Blyttiomyces sp. JEL0837]